MLKISRFTVENLTEGCVTDNLHPLFAFSLESDVDNTCIKKAVLWVNDWTTEMTEAQQVGIPYAGKKLTPFTRYQARLTVEDNHGQTAESTAEFETGRLDSPWKAQWITDPAYRFVQKKVSPVPMTFRRDICLKKEVKCARIYATAMGIYELSLNGKKVGEDYFAPGYTAYRKRLQYQTYDVTESLAEENRLTAVVAGGWAVGAFNYKRVNRAYANRQAFLCELRVEYTDGSVEIYGTNEKWQVSREGNYRAAEFYAGENYDATIELETVPWANAGIEKLPIHPQITAACGAMVRRQEHMEPVSVHRTKSGVLLYDFGQNFAGVIHAKITGKKGHKIVFRHAEVLMDGELFTKPLRSALQQAIYICRDGEQEYSPRLTYMGFRYVSVEGIEEKDITLTAFALYSDMEDNGSFACSNELVNRLQNAIRWGAKSNFVDIPTDCPQRDERMGWTGDIAVFSPTAVYNFNLSRFLRKWLLDVKAEQRRGGGIPMVVPLTVVPMQWEIMIPMAVDHWGDACIWVPWAEYMARGDVSILEEMYPVMQKYIKACKFWAGLFSVGKHRRIWKLLHHYGDWCAPNVNMWGWMGRGKWTATAAMARSAANLAQIARILGKEEDAACYEKLSAETADAYRSILMDKDCRVKKEFQTAYVLPLHYHMLQEQDRKKTAQNLAELVRRENHHIATGFPGTPYILFALSDNGYVQDAYKMLLNDTCPSWLYEMKAGGTTTWERWDALREDGTCNTGEDDGTGGMVSFNHYASGAVGDFLYRRVAGIEMTEPGYRSFVIKPVPGGDLTWAKASVMTPYGRISSEWKIEENEFEIAFEVPVGTTCRLELPDGSRKEYHSGCYRCKAERVQGADKQKQ